MSGSAFIVSLLLVPVLGDSLSVTPSAVAALRPARADDAVRACGVTSIDDVRRVAVVPPEHQDGYFMSIPDASDPLVLLCGDGATTGAVHIEVKHDVPNWGDALNCMENAVEHGKPTRLPDRTRYEWWLGGKKMVVVNGDYSVITAYPSDGLEETWIECSTAA
ncbi:hypothetical protein ACU61A_36190 [Pseudonocardia sichuanensis]